MAIANREWGAVMRSWILSPVAVGLFSIASLPAAGQTATPMAPSAAPGPTANTITGRTLSAIRYQGPQGRGSFTAMPDGTWVNESAQGRTTYVQYSRMAWVVHMFERHRGNDILIDLQRMKVRQRTPEASDLFDIVEVRAIDGSVAGRASAPTDDNCGGYREAACLQGANQYCDEGLVPFYSHEGAETTCNYSRRQVRQFERGAPYPVRFPALNPSNPEHRKRLEAKVTISLIPPDFDGAKARAITVQANGSDSIRDLIGIFAARNQLSASEAGQIGLSITREATGFEHPDVELEEAQTVAAYGLREGTRLGVGGKQACKGTSCGFTLFYFPVKELSNVRAPGGSLEMKAGNTVGQLRSSLSRQATPVRITLLHEGKVLDDDNRTLASLGIGVDDDVAFVGMIARSDAPAPVAERSFGCDESWRWTSGAITVESDHRSCSLGAATSHWTIRGVAARPLRATGVADDRLGLLTLTFEEAGQQVSLRVNRIRSTAPNSSEFRYGVASDSALIGTGRWERLQP